VRAVNSKWDRFAGADPSQLLVITDFDATITAGDADQCHDLMGKSPLLSKAFREEFAPLLDWTTNAAIDGVEWWDKAHELMLKHGMPPRSRLPGLVRDAFMPPRPGALQMLEKLAKMNVPVLIVSAGARVPAGKRPCGTMPPPALALTPAMRAGRAQG